LFSVKKNTLSNSLKGDKYVKTGNKQNNGNGTVHDENLNKNSI